MKIIYVISNKERPLWSVVSDLQSINSLFFECFWYIEKTIVIL